MWWLKQKEKRKPQLLFFLSCNFFRVFDPCSLSNELSWWKVLIISSQRLETAQLTLSFPLTEIVFPWNPSPITANFQHNTLIDIGLLLSVSEQSGKTHSTESKGPSRNITDKVGTICLPKTKVSWAILNVLGHQLPFQVPLRMAQVSALSSVCANWQVTAGGSKGSLERFSIRMADGETNGWAIIKVRINLLKYQSRVPLATLGCFTWPPPSSPKQCQVYSLNPQNPGASPMLWGLNAHCQLSSITLGSACGIVWICADCNWNINTARHKKTSALTFL